MDLFKLKGNLHIWSNLAYLIAGFFMGSWWLLLSMAFMAFTSFMGHWKGGQWWIWDWAGMYVVFSSVILFHIGVAYLIPLIIPLITYITLKWLDDSLYILVGVLWLASVFVSFLYGVSVLPAIIVFAIALLVRQLAPEMEGKYYDICHSIWHVLTATGIFLLVSII
jgi:hypothetical protein